MLRDTVANCCGTLEAVVCDGLVWPALELPHRPVVDVLEVTIDGDPFVDFRVVDDRYLIRDDRAPWPAHNDLSQEASGPGSQPGTWEVEYRYGSAPPADLRHAAELLACELLASWCTGTGCPECHLPERITSLTYEGATAAILDPFSFMDSGGFGIPQIDYAVRAHNPNRLERVGKVVTPADVLRSHYRVRQP